MQGILDDIRVGKVPPVVKAIVKRMHEKGRTDEEAARIIAVIMIGAKLGDREVTGEQVEEVFRNAPDELL